MIPLNAKSDYDKVLLNSLALTIFQLKWNNFIRTLNNNWTQNGTIFVTIKVKHRDVTNYIFSIGNDSRLDTRCTQNKNVGCDFVQFFDLSNFAIMLFYPIACNAKDVTL